MLYGTYCVEFLVNRCLKHSCINRFQPKLTSSPMDSISPDTTMTNASTVSVSSERRIQIPLPLAYVARRQHHFDSNEEAKVSTGESSCCCIEIFSPDLTQFYLICAGSSKLAGIWFKSLNRHVTILNQLHLQQLMRVLPQYQVILLSCILLSPSIFFVVWV